MKSNGKRGPASAIRAPGQFAPGDELNVLFPEQLVKFRADEKIKIALTPCGAPGVTFARGGFHFLVGVSDVDDELGDAGLKILEGRLVEFAPFLGRDVRIDGNRVIEDDVSGT